jgi:preprotein translocase subunit SecF
MNIIKYRVVWYLISGVLIVCSLAALAVWGLKFGIDFTGGSIQEITWSVARPSSGDITAVFNENGIESALIQNSGDDKTIHRFKNIGEEDHAKVLNALKNKFATKETPAPDVLEENTFSSIGPTVGRELKVKSVYAIIMVLVAIILYIAWAFRRVSRPVASWKYGLTAVIALLHDVIIPLGAFAAFGHFFGYEVDILFVTAVLTILGFSVHDTIVVFDRIRENLLKSHGTFSEIVGESISQTFVRSINTSATVLVVLLAVYLFGGDSIKNFVLVLIIGVFFGTYSSIFLA